MELLTTEDCAEILLWILNISICFTFCLLGEQTLLICCRSSEVQTKNSHLQLDRCYLALILFPTGTISFGVFCPSPWEDCSIFSFSQKTDFVSVFHPDCGVRQKENVWHMQTLKEPCFSRKMYCCVKSALIALRLLKLLSVYAARPAQPGATAHSFTPK